MNYKYCGLELTPAIFEALLIQLFDGKQFSRQDAIDKVKAYHLENGGVLNKGSYINVFKKSAQRLKDKGIENIGYGVWRLCYEAKAVDEIIPKQQQEQFSFRVDKEIGNGNSSIYVYYYDSYKELAVIKGTNSWECKIGRTDVEPIGRILSQAGTCYPELPHIALIVYCDDSALLEKTIHNILKMKQKWIPDAPGKEWFNTSPEEIEELYYSIFGK